MPLSGPKPQEENVAKKKRKRPQRRPKRSPSPGARTQATPSDGGNVALRTSFGTIQVPAALAEQMGAHTEDEDASDGYLLDLTDCEVELTYMSPAGATRALVEAEHLDPAAADQLARSLPMMVPSLLIRGERGRLLATAPTLRRVREAALYSGDTHRAIMGMVYDLPRVCLAEFANGAEADSAVAELSKLNDAWDGWLLILLVSEAPGKGPADPFKVGEIIAAHEVKLDRSTRQCLADG